MKVSFDFDSTLSRKNVQRFAKELVAAGHEVWIVTSRVSDEMANNYPTEFKNRVLKENRKLFRVADNVGIKRNHIIFTGFVNKIEFIKGKDFIFHLDDDLDELMEIFSSKDPCKPINVEHSEWEMDCRELIEIEKYLENPNKGYT
jgi:hypothetical protein